jgi:hypothetical protein|tara:strand:- start:264 stop:1028 length:765 start_codon:yes stop_codon:yes gene_type:complete
MTPRGKRAKDEQHPGLVDNREKPILEEIPGWDRFSEFQREFLVMRANLSTHQAALQATNHDRAWLSRNRQNDRLFDDAVQFVKERAINPSRIEPKGLKKMALAKLHRYLTLKKIEDDPPPGLKAMLDVIQVVLKVDDNILGEEKAPTRDPRTKGKTTVNAVNPDDMNGMFEVPEDRRTPPWVKDYNPETDQCPHGRPPVLCGNCVERDGVWYVKIFDEDDNWKYNQTWAKYLQGKGGVPREPDAAENIANGIAT